MRGSRGGVCPIDHGKARGRWLEFRTVSWACGRHSLRQCFANSFARFLNLGLTFAREDDRMGIGVMNLRDGAGAAGHLGRNDVDWPSGWQGKFLQRPDAAHLLHYAGETFFDETRPKA
jgi:hypothetical protein